MTTPSVQDAVRGVHRHARAGSCTVALGVTSILALFLPTSPVSQLIAVVGACILSGSFAASFLSIPGGSPARSVAVSAGLGVLGFLLVGAVLGSVLPHLGDARPLTRVTLVVAWSLLEVAIVLSALIRRVDPVRQMLAGVRAGQLAWGILLALCPLIALAGAIRLNDGAGPGIAIIAAALAVLMTALAVFLSNRPIGPPRVLLLVSSVVTLAWQGPLRGGWLSGFDIQHEYFIGNSAISQGVFPLSHQPDAYAGMLSLTVWPAQLHALAGINLRTTLALAPGLFLGLALLCVWSALRDRCSERTAAALCAGLVVGCGPIVAELPEITRQCYGLFFFALLVLAIATRSLPVASRRWIIAASGVGIAVTHYSSAYLAAGAVLVGCALSYASREPRASRVLTLPVTSVVAGAAFLWGGFVAKTGNNFQQVLNSIRADGLQFLPGTGSALTRWLHAASISQLVNARVIRAADLHLRATTYRWMTVAPGAGHVALVNDPAPTSRGAPVIGSVLSSSGQLLSELILVAAVVGALYCLWAVRRDRTLSAIAGVGAFFIGAAALSRLSQTIGVDFGPSRVEAQSYVVLAITLGIALTGILGKRNQRWTALSARRRNVAVIAVSLAAALAVMTSSELSNLVERGAQIPFEMSSSGEAAQRLLNPEDILAAQWLDENRPQRRVIQADRFGQLALYVYGLNEVPPFIDSVDPVIVDRLAWVFADNANTVSGTARGGNNARTGVFRFPAAYFDASRTIVYVSSGDVVYGIVPYGSRPLSETGR